MPNYPQQVLSYMLDAILPKVCLGCGRFTDKSHFDFDYVCRKCFGGIKLKSAFECMGCKRQTQFGLTCTFCKKENDANPERNRESSQRAPISYEVDQLIIAAELTDPLVDKMVKTYKYKFIADMLKPLFVIAKKCIKKLLSKGFNIFEDSPLLVPVPLHKRRFNWRGFNQAELLAKNIADTYHVSYAGDVLIRIVNSKHQADIKLRDERLANIKNHFTVKNWETVEGRTVILVDDVCTTGATLNECARVLKNPPFGGGAKKVIGFVIARG